MRNDNVNHPSHYTSGPFECIELTSRYPFLGGNAIKYVYRWQDKNGLEDLRKALWYLNRAKAESPYEPIGLYPLDSLVPPYGHFHIDDESVHMLRKLARLNWQKCEDSGRAWPNSLATTSPVTPAPRRCWNVESDYWSPC